ncbi:MAG: hypothetical protein PHH54_05320 [Candidatus Nanoarchaeia archaeon]|nr:hypothetical protein [Candidatus Nanoarchaeia archaeon]MDD5741378.1 hypothetical protein [Candidatus Nanoarchaeia archaeon]
MKRGVRKDRRKFDIKKTILYKILIVFVVILCVLILIWVELKINERGKERGLKGELGTLKWDFNQEKVILSVLNYTVYNDNQTIDVNINWSSGNQTINSIFVKFIRTQGDCNFTILSGFPSFEENETYAINYDAPACTCAPTNFENVMGINVYAQIHVNLTQTGLIPNITFYKDDSRQNLINLGQYFSSLVNVNYSVVESPSNENISVSLDNTAKNVSISLLDSLWFGSQKFNLTATSDDGDVLNTANSGENMSFYLIVLNYTRPTSNNFPSFNRTACDDLEWEVNDHYHLDMEDCWYDLDGDSLRGYRYGNASWHTGNLTITNDSNELTLTSKTDWIGGGYFYVYASDGKNESQDRVDFEVLDNSDDGNGDGDGGNGGTNNTNTAARNPDITSSSPSGSDVFIFPGNKTFSITARDYVSIKWYLNGAVIIAADDRLSYDFSKLKEGDIIKVDVINETRVDSKTWNIKLQTNAEGETPVFDVGSVIFYAIIAILGIIIILVIWLFFIEKNKDKGKIGVGFGISGPEGNVRVSGGKGSSLDYFNIPG